MKRYSRKLVIPDSSSDQSYNRELFDDLQRDITSLKLNTKNSGIKLEKTVDNSINASAEQHFIGELDSQDIFLNGFAGSYTGNITFKKDARVNNFHFKGTVIISAGATVQFSGCRFEKLVTNEDGAFSHYVAPLFKGSSAVLNNAVAATDVSIVCSSRKSGITHTNVTILSETT